MNTGDYRRILLEKKIEFQCKKGGGFEALNTQFYLPKK
jgi:hypothetical protein